MDAKVLQAQQWVNKTYKGVSGYTAITEDGITGWATMFAFTRALQSELGITTLSDVFGPATLSSLTAFGPISIATTRTNMRILVEAALYCKGYSGGTMDGGFGGSTQGGLINWKSDMGFAPAATDNAVSAKEMRTLLSMDAYVLLSGGDGAVRDVQRWLNVSYVSCRDFQIVPCDGFFSRNVQKGLMMAVQYSLGMADGVADGIYGPATRSALVSQPALAVGSSDAGAAHFVELFKAGLIFNKVSGVDWGGQDFTATTSSVTATFQRFCLLAETGRGDFPTWMSLLISTGDPERPGKAADCATPLNDARAKAIKAAGYETVGRYITQGLAKSLTPSELQIIFANGLTLLPIYQESNNALKYFDPGQGAAQGTAACQAAASLGLPRGAIIYFAVDYDATTDEVRSHILPFFAGIAQSMNSLGDTYSIGVYGSRNICSMVSDAGMAVSSFVGGMSTGFSGNLGFPLPQNWAFDQIKTLTLASRSAGAISIDNDIKSNRDPGISNLTTPIDQNSVFFTWVRWIEDRASEWYSQGHHDNSQQMLTAFYLRTYIDQKYNNTKFAAISGSVDNDFITYCKSINGRPLPGSLRDPKTGMLCDIEHFGASIGAVLAHDLKADKGSVSLVDFGGWAGDLITMVADCYNSGVPDSGAYDYGYRLIGNTAGQKSFSGGDMLADVDAMTVGSAIRGDGSLKISDLLGSRYSSVAASTSKYQEFVTARFNDGATFATASAAVLNQTSDIPFSVVRDALWQSSILTTPIGVALGLHPTLFSGISGAFVDVVQKKFIG